MAEGFVIQPALEKREVTFTFKVGMSMEDVEKGVIAMILDCYKGNRTKAAKVLGLSRATLYNKIRKYNL